MGLFNNNYNKPGPGIDKNAPPKRRAIVFFELFREKLSRLIGINLFMFACALVLFIFAFIIYYFTENLQIALIPVIPITFPICGLTLITRKIARDEVCFLVMDYKEAMKKNWKFSLITGIINYLFAALMSIALPFYWNNAQTDNINYIFFLFLMTFCLIFVFVQFYLYLMAVTFELKIVDIFKNSFIFAIVNFWTNLLLAVLAVVITLVSLYTLELIDIPILGGITIVFLALIIFSGFSFLKNFAVWPKVESLMIDSTAQVPQQEEKSSVHKADELKRKHHYENGRMVIDEEEEDL